MICQIKNALRNKHAADEFTLLICNFQWKYFVGGLGRIKKLYMSIHLSIKITFFEMYCQLK